MQREKLGRTKCVCVYLYHPICHAMRRMMVLCGIRSDLRRYGALRANLHNVHDAHKYACHRLYVFMVQHVCVV